jgi:hypothetical protein
LVKYTRLPFPADLDHLRAAGQRLSGRAGCGVRPVMPPIRTDPVSLGW